MSRWLLIASAAAALAVVLTVVVIANNGDNSDRSDGPLTGTAGEQVPPEVARVKETVFSFRRALQGKGGDPCAYLTEQAKTLAISIDDPNQSCAEEVRDAVLFDHERQIPAESATEVVVRGAEAAAVDVSGPVLPTALVLVKRGGQWLIAEESEVSAARELQDALKRGEGL